MSERASNNTRLFHGLEFSGINPAAVAYYEYHPAPQKLRHVANGVVDGEVIISNEPKLTVLLRSGDDLTFEGSDATALFQALSQNHLPSLSEEQQNALDSLKAFFAECFLESECSTTHYGVAVKAKIAAEKALSVLGA